MVMKMLSNEDTRKFLTQVSVILAFFFLLAELLAWFFARPVMGWMVLFFLVLSGAVLGCCFSYFRKQNRILEEAVSSIEAYLDGDNQARIPCDKEGELYRLFHSVNTLSAILNAHAANEIKDKEFLKNTISDISHQLKTPLAALNIYNGLLQSETEELPEIREFADLSEQELERMETLVQNLLKITRLDAGVLVFEKQEENVADMMKDLELSFAFRARQERKNLILSGEEGLTLCCDRNWLLEALTNLVKNAFDHTEEGDTIRVEWKALPTLLQIRISDTGGGIHPEDLPHIFKRFYRSRFSQDTQGIGLGLPLAKGIVEAHQGTISVDSELGNGTTFVLHFPGNSRATPIPTKL